MNLKLITYGIALLAVLGFAGWINHTLNKNKRLEAENVQLVSENQGYKDAAITKDKKIAEAAKRDESNQKDIEAIKHELEPLKTCIANKSCGFVVHFKPQACPPSCSAITSQPVPNEGASPSGVDFEQWYFDLLGAIRDNKQHILSLQEDLRIRSSPDYCKAK